MLGQQAGGAVDVERVLGGRGELGECGREPVEERAFRVPERRANLLEMLRSTIDERSVFMWIGDENPAPELRSVSVIGANYGLGYRNLGTVGVVGPLRMDYATAIASVQEAAGELSRFFESVYE